MEHTNSDKFKRFDVVSDVSDHHFLAKSNGGDCFSNAQSRVNKTIMKEWRILQQNLPDSIFVRVYETRIDLLRAAIIGTAGTPYHDGLFFFDIAFPPDYPTHPPKVHYHSNGYRLNPNLYENGRVCLSLLNTWSGSRSERWNPKQSTLLQVLLSIQSLVLNEKPYFNEPGSHTFGSEKWSQDYNRCVFVSTCKSTIHLIRNPPKNFEPFVYGHFRERASTTLTACEEYANGRVRVGFHGCDGSGQSTARISRKFQANIKAVYPQLVSEFRRIGASLGNSSEHLRLEAKPPVKKKSSAKQKSSDGVFKNLFGKMKDILGLKKKNNSGKKENLQIEGN